MEQYPQWAASVHRSDFSRTCNFSKLEDLFKPREMQWYALSFRHGASNWGN